MTLQIRKAEDGDIPKLMSLFNAHVTPHKSADTFRWWNSFPSIMFCAEVENEIVGTFLVLKRKLNNNLNCGVIMGLIIKPEWRGKGLFKKLGVEAMDYFEDIDLFCCLPNIAGKRALELNFGFKTIETINTMTRSSNSPSECQCYTRSLITTSTEFNNFVSDKKDTVMFLADEEFRRWRFATHHRYSYEVVFMDTGEFAVINKYYNVETDVRYGDIVDFESKELEENRLMKLFYCASAGLREDVDDLTIQAVPNTLLSKVAKKMGFVDSNVKHHFCIKVKESKNDYLYYPSNWLIKWGDYLR